MGPMFWDVDQDVKSFQNLSTLAGDAARGDFWCLSLSPEPRKPRTLEDVRVVQFHVTSNGCLAAAEETMNVVSYVFSMGSSAGQVLEMTTLVVVDPVSTGAFLCRVAASRGFRVIALWSRELSATVRHRARISDAMTFASASVEEEESLEATVKALKSQVKSDEWLECIPGSEWGVQLAERVCCALKLRGNGSFFDRRNKELQRQALETADLRVTSEEAIGIGSRRCL